MSFCSEFPEIDSEFFILNNPVFKNVIDFLSNFLDFSPEIMTLIGQYVVIDKKMTCFVQPFDYYVKNHNDKNKKYICYSILNHYAYGIPKKTLFNYSKLMHFGLTWLEKDLLKRNSVAQGKFELKRTKKRNEALVNNYVIIGNTLQKNKVIFNLKIKENIGDKIHYLESLDKETETLNAALEEVICTRINKTFVLDKKGLSVDKKSCAEWELIQTVYVLAKKFFRQKHKNLHVSKKQSILGKVDTYLEDIKKLYNYFLSDMYYYVAAEDHYTLKLKKIQVPREIEKMVWYQPPSIMEKVVKSNPKYDSVFLRQYGEVKKYPNTIINEEEFEKYCKRKKIREKNSFRNFLIHLSKGIVDIDTPVSVRHFDLIDLEKKRLKEFTNMEAFKVFMSDDPSILFSPAPYFYTEDFLNKYEDMDFKTIDFELKKEFSTLSSGQLKKRISTLKNEIIRRKMENLNKVDEYVEVRQSPYHVRTKEIVYDTHTKQTLEPVSLLESEEKHSDFLRHYLGPIDSILLRNNRFILSKMKRSRMHNSNRNPHYKKFKNLCNLVSSIKTATKKISNAIFLLREGIHCPTNSLEHLKSVRFDRANKFTEEYQEYRNLFNPVLENIEPPDFNMYDFQYINNLKFRILTSQICWSRDTKKLKVSGSIKRKKLIIWKKLQLLKE